MHENDDQARSDWYEAQRLFASTVVEMRNAETTIRQKGQ